jgi:hypothetical protein
MAYWYFVIQSICKVLVFSSVKLAVLELSLELNFMNIPTYQG